MICPKCGNEMGEGKMYCERCGEEIQFVPDYEPEIENSISDVLSDVADQIDPTRVAEQFIDEEEDNDADEISMTEDILEASNSLVSNKPVNDKDSISVSRIQIISVLSVLVGIILVLIIVFSVYISRDNSEEYQMDQGDVAFAQRDYNDALSYYEKVYRLNTDDIEPLYRIAECYKMLDNNDRALDVYKMIVGKDVDQDEAWDGLVSLLAAKGDFSEISRYVSSYGTDVQKNKYAQYISEPPEFNYENGEYNEMIGIEITSKSDGCIYYTTDGSEPGSDCSLYDTPIALRNGEYHIKAVFVNDFGICSDVVEGDYTIITDAPSAPEISLDEGHYNVPQIISVSVPGDVIVYYTTDGSEPNVNSAIYTDPISIPVGDSWYRFVAASKNGNLSEEVQRKYILTVDTVVSQEEALLIVKNKQFEVGRVLDTEGTVISEAGKTGKYMYTYSEMRYVQNRTLYFISEYYQEDTIRMTTGNIFAVDVYDGTMYQAVLLENGDYKLNTFGQ